jgi:hypothetical protein
MAGTGFVLEPAMAAQNDRVAESATLASGSGRHAEQLDAYDGIAAAHAEKAAAGTLAGATAVITAAQNKTDATQLAAPVAMLSNSRRSASGAAAGPGPSKPWRRMSAHERGSNGNARPLYAS